MSKFNNVKEAGKNLASSKEVEVLKGAATDLVVTGAKVAVEGLRSGLLEILELIKKACDAGAKALTPLTLEEKMERIQTEMAKLQEEIAKNKGGK